MTVYLQTIINAVTGHHTLAYGLVCLLALTESVTIVGAVLPGTALIAGMSALVPSGALNVWPLVIAAILGTIVGDALSYGVGRRYRQTLTAVWPFTRYPQLISRGEAFFQQHGSRGAFLARFTPGVRAVIPLAAGMADMPVGRFYRVNILSALVWASLHMLPSLLVGATLALAGAIAPRLAAFLGLTIVVLWLTAMAARFALRHGLPYLTVGVSVSSAGVSPPWLWKVTFIGHVMTVLLIGGCTTYQSMPMTPDAVHAKLQPPNIAALHILASEINHPILRPVDLKLNEGLSPDGAAVLAVLLNPSLRAVRDQRALSSAQLLDAGLLPNPELTYSLDVPTGGDTAGRVTAYSLGLNWDAISLISRASKINESKARKEAVDLDIAWQEWQVAQAAKAAIYQVLALQNQIALAEQAYQQMTQMLVQLQKAVADGAMTTHALNAAQAASLRANENLLSLEKQAEHQRLQLRRLLGLPTDMQIRLSQDIHLPSRVEPPTGATLLEGLEQRRLDLLALRRGYDSQEAAVRVAIMEQFPRISIGPTMSRDTDSMRTIGFGLNIELPIFNRNQGKIAREQATRQKLFDEYVNRVFEAHSDIELVLSGIRFTNEQIATAQAAEAELGRLVENYRAALADGRTDALIYYTAWNDRVEVQIKMFALKGQLAQTIVALQLTAGFYEIPQSGSRR